MTWFEHDPHARAARTLQSSEFQRILTSVSGAAADTAATRTVYRQCAACHDPEGLSSADASSADAAGASPVAVDAAPSVSIGGRGIGCESCHGNARLWLAKHYERGANASQLTRLGLRDLRDVVLRGRVCAGCHVGDDDHDMNHDMIAAGHPPLRFELSAYHDLIRTKHWRERGRVRGADFQLQLWAAGQVAVADATLGLTAARATRATKDLAAVPRANGPVKQEVNRPNAPWPEFAEYDCFACHQRLRPLTDVAPRRTPSLAAGSREVIPWQTWNLSADGPGARWLAEPHGASSGGASSGGASSGGTSSGGTSSGGEQTGDWFFAFEKLRGEMSDLRRADPVRVAALANDGRLALRRKFAGSPALNGARPIEFDPASSRAPTAGTPGQHRAFVESSAWPLIGRSDAAVGSWAEACHEWLLLRAAYLSLADRRHWSAPTVIGERPSTLPVAISLEPARRASLERQFQEVARALSFGSTEIEWPAYDWSGLPARGEGAAPPSLPDLKTIAAALQSLANELQSLRGGRSTRDEAINP